MRWAVGRGLVLAAAVALSACAARAETMFAAVRLNGVDTGKVVAFERSGANLYLPWAELRKLGVTGGSSQDAFADLSRIEGLRFQTDDARQEVHIDVAPSMLPLARVELGRQTSAAPDRAAWGGVANYAFNVLGSQAWVGGEGRIFGPAGMLTHGFVVNAGQEKSVRRLDTTYVLDDYRHGRTLRVGDFVSTGAAWRRPIRAGGISFGTDAGLRPDLFSQPLLEAPGEAALPSTVELYMDGVAQYRTDVGPGRFMLTAPPLVNSSGQAVLVVTDALGRRSLDVLPFYASDRLLRPGSTAYSIDIGALRKGYGSASDHYGESFASASFRRGMSRTFTLEAEGQVSEGGLMGGVGGVATLLDAAVVSGAFQVSQRQGRTGTSFHLSARRETASYSIWSSYDRRSDAFAELGRSQATSGPADEAQVGGSAQLDRWGTIAFAYGRRTSASRTQGFTSATWSSNFGRARVFANATRARPRGGGLLVSVGLSMPLGGQGGQGSLGYDSSGGGRVNAQFSQPPPAMQGWGVRAAADQPLAANARAGVDVEVRGLSPFGELAVGWAARGSASQLRAAGSGSAVWLGGGLRLARQTGEAFALVETGLPNVDVAVEHRIIGRTGQDGALLALGLPARVATHIEIVAQSVPLDSDIDIHSVTVRPPRGAAVVARMPVQKSQAQALRILGPDGEAPPLGASVQVNARPSGLVGFDGWTYLQNVEDDNVIEIGIDGGTCRLSLSHRSLSDAGGKAFLCQMDSVGLRRVLVDRRDPSIRRAELRSDDPSGGLRDLQGDRAGGQDGARSDRPEVHMHVSGLRRLWLQLGHTLRELGLGDRSPNDEKRRNRDIALSDLR